MMIVPRRNREFDLFDDFFNDGELFSKRQLGFMKTDIKEEKDKYVIEAELPGCDKENISLELNNGYLEISAKVVKETSDKDEQRYIRQERFFGESSRSFYVGDQVTQEDIDAEFKNGVLKIVVPKNEKVEETPLAKRIEIK